MADATAIEWCDSTFNPWMGCTKVSPACDNCYAAVSTPARTMEIVWGPGQPRRRTAPRNWTQPLAWDRALFMECRECGWRAEVDRSHQKCGRCHAGANSLQEARRRVFCASLADVFDNEVDPAWRRDLFKLIAETPNLDWLLLTKRVGNVLRLVKEIADLPRPGSHAGDLLAHQWRSGNPPKNVWLGITVCDQKEANRDIPKLLAVHAAKRFLSMEPLLGPVDLTRIDVFGGDAEIYPLKGTTDCVNDEGEPTEDVPALDWVIVGGESGHGARPMHPDWARSLRDQCAEAGVPFVMKQWGEWVPISQLTEAQDRALWRSRVIAKPHEDQTNIDDVYGRVCTVKSAVMHLDGSLHHFLEPNAFSAGAMTMYQTGKKAAGRLLDGRTWDGVPS